MPPVLLSSRRPRDRGIVGRARSCSDKLMQELCAAPQRSRYRSRALGSRGTLVPRMPAHRTRSGEHRAIGARTGEAGPKMPRLLVVRYEDLQGCATSRALRIARHLEPLDAQARRAADDSNLD